MMRRIFGIALAALSGLALLGGCADDVPQEAAQIDNPAADRVIVAAAPAAKPAPAAEPKPAGRPSIDKLSDDDPTAEEIEWDTLIPVDWRPDKLMADYNIDELSDDDPRAMELMEKLQALWDKAPVREDLDGRDVKLPGFIVPVEADENETTSFLLVPYYGACIHVPPPPANQTVFVLTEPGKGTRPELFDVVWVTGTLSVKRIENDIAEAGYTLYAHNVAPYE